MLESPDNIIYWQWHFVQLNATIVFTWLVMAVLVIGSWAITSRLSTGATFSRWQNLLEVVVDYMRTEIRSMSHDPPDRYLPFVGTIFVFIAACALLMIVPGFVAPTSSLSTTTALAIAVFAAVPIYGVINQGAWGYLKNYFQPTPLMFPFHVVGELSRTLALAVRLFGNMMSGAKIAGILLAIVPLLIPALMNGLGLLTGMIQAYIFAMLAMIYIASGRRSRPEKDS